MSCRKCSIAWSCTRGKGGILFPKRIPPFESPRERRGESPLAPRIGSRALEGLPSLRSVSALLFFVSIRFGLLLSSLPLCLRVGSLQQSPPTLDFISLAGAYQGGIASLAAFIALSVEGGRTALTAVRTTENACTADRRKLGCTDGRYAERQRVVEVHQIVSHPPMAASEAMPPRKALPLPRRRTSSRSRLPMEFSLGGSKGGVSLFEKEIPLPCFACSSKSAALPFTASAKLPAHDSYTPACQRLLRAR